MFHIAIDGPGGAGKSTIAKAVAKKLDISRSYVSRIEKRVINDLREKFEEKKKNELPKNDSSNYNQNLFNEKNNKC